MDSLAVNERPLTPWAKTGLIASTGAVILLFYLFTLIAAILLIALLGFELVLVIALLRFGAAGWMIKIMDAHVRVIGLLLRSLWLPGEALEYRINLKEPDAPGLFKMVRALSERFGVLPPDDIRLEMSVNAWVQLRGLRSGRGKTRLGIGYDLLAGLTVSEIEGVLAHEMAHAKLIQRGFKRFANSALNRCSRMVGLLSGHVQEGRDQKLPRHLAQMLLTPSEALIRTLARLVAAYSRQDEFEADRGAAELCGANSLRSALLKLDPIEEASSRLPWRERVAQLQTGQSYSEWFAKELSASLAGERPPREASVFDKYSTHPAMQDRLSALPADADLPTDHTPALTLIASPDVTAQNLVAEIQRVGAIAEEKDTKALAKWKRSAESRKALRGPQLLGIALIFIGGFMGLAGLFEVGRVDWGMVGIGAMFGAGGVALFRSGKYRDRATLSVPPYPVIIHARDKPFNFEVQADIEKELDQLAASEKKKKKRGPLLVAEAYKALERCDYLRAHVAARVCFKHDPKSIEGHIAFAIAAAAVNQGDLAAKALNFVQHHAGIRTESTAWGAAWALILLGDWAPCEALLDAVIAKKPGHSALLSLASLARSRRGKLNSAIAKSRQACTPSAPDKDQATLLIGLLIDAGLLREASDRLMPLESIAQTDAALQLQMLRLKLLTRDIPAAEHWVALYRQTETGPRTTLDLAGLFHQARQLDRAEGLYHETLQHGHFPEALLGLAQIDAERRHKTSARERLLRALNLKTPLAEKAAGPFQLFISIVGQLASLNDVTACRAWNCTLPSTGKYDERLSNTNFLICAPDQVAARQCAVEILTAMEPAFDPNDLIWTEAPKDQQPVRPLRPGIQRVTVTSVKPPVVKRR